MKELFSFKRIDGKKFYELLLIWVVITLPFSIKLNSYAIVLLFLRWLIEGNWKQKWVLIKSNNYAILLIGFFGYHAIGVLYSNNVHDGLFDLEKKISFLALPILLTTHRINQALINRVLYSFIGSCFFASLICLLNALYQAYSGDFSFLFYHKLGSPLSFHAVYFSLYIGVSIFFIFFTLKENWFVWRSEIRFYLISLILYFLGFLILLSSKMLITVVFVLLAFSIARLLFISTGVKAGVIALLFSIVFFVVGIMAVPSVKERFGEILTESSQQVNPLFLDDYRNYHFTGGTIRLAIWKICIEIVNRENAWLWGVGTGDTQDLLTAAYVEKHVYPGDGVHEGFMHYNAHNQFLQFILALGLVGLMWFIVIFLFLFYDVVVRKDAVFLALLLIFFAFCLTESTLCAQKGIVFFAYFSSLFMSQSRINL